MVVDLKSIYLFRRNVDVFPELENSLSAARMVTGGAEILPIEFFWLR